MPVTDAIWPRRRRAVELDGWLHPAFTPVADALRAQLADQDGGAAVCVYHRGRCVADLWGGTTDAAGAPWRRETMAPSFSTTKGVAATLLHVLVDRGLLDYDDRVARFWPEFAQSGKAAITVRQVLCHQSGLYHIRQMIDGASRMLDWAFMIRAIERAAPVHAPGARTGYHGLTFGFLVGEIAQRVTGQPFTRLVRELIAEPLDCDGLHIGATEAALPHAARLLWAPRGPLPIPDLATAHWVSTWFAGVPAAAVRRALRLAGVDVDFDSMLDALAPRGIRAFDFGAAETLRAAIPAANGLFTARSLARMYAALAGGGTLDGVRLLSDATLRRATTVQPPAPRLVVIPFDMRWRLGYHGVLTSRGVPRHAFGHFGFGGSGAWADPSRELAVALIVNSGLGTPFGDWRIVRIGGAALAGAAASSAAAPGVEPGDCATRLGLASNA